MFLVMAVVMLIEA